MEQDWAAAGNLLDECPEVSRIALASAGSRRDIWLAAFALDGRIGRMVLGASEPMLGQMRLAWWRDQLGAPASARPQGDLLLDLIGRTWAGNELPLLSGQPTQRYGRKRQDGSGPGRTWPLMPPRTANAIACSIRSGAPRGPKGSFPRRCAHWP